MEKSIVGEVVDLNKWPTSENDGFGRLVFTEGRVEDLSSHYQ